MQSQSSRKEKSEKDIEKDIIQTFSQYGYMLRPNTLKMCLSFFISEYNEGRSSLFSTTMKEIINNLRMLYTNNLELAGTTFVEEDALEEAIKIHENKLGNPNKRAEMEIEDRYNEIEMNNVAEEAEEDEIGDLITRKLTNSIVVLNAYTDFPNLVYDIAKQAYVENDKLPQIFNSPEEKLNTFKQRFILVREKMVRSKEYIFPFQNNVNHDGKYMKISEVGSLLGSKGEKNVLGIIFQGENNQYYLQDLTTKMTVKFEAGVVAGNQGFFLNNQIVIATGVYKSDVFLVKSLAQPEVNQTSVEKHLSNKDYFGAHAKLNKLLGDLLRLEIGELKSLSLNGSQSQSQDKKRAFDKIYNNFIAKQKSIGIFDLKLDKHFMNTNFEDLSIFVLSCFHLDKKEVQEKFRTILEKCSSIQPLMFILIGELSSNQKIDTSEEFDEFNQNIEAFLELLEEFPLIMKTCFWIFVPGIQFLSFLS